MLLTIIYLFPLIYKYHTKYLKKAILMIKEPMIIFNLKHRIILTSLTLMGLALKMNDNATYGRNKYKHSY